MNKWTFRDIFCHFVVKNLKLYFLVTLIFMIFLLAAYLQQNGIQEYSRYNWLQGNRELLSVSNTGSNYKLSSNSTTHSTPVSIDTSEENNKKFISDSCQPKYNVVFIKTHKCASSTVQNIFMRYGFINNKIFVLPAKANYLGHPMPFNKYLVPDPNNFNNQYNILTHHTRLNYESMQSLMPNNTVFITIVRDPVDLFESMFHYYRLDKFWNITFDAFGNESIAVPSKIHTNRYMGKIGINQMMFDLGMNISDFTKPYTVRKYIDQLDNIFDLVMISERMDESLVLLKNLLCWTTDDVIAFKLNARQHNAKRSLTEISSSQIKGLNWADHQLYKHFSRKFSLIVKAFGREKMKREIIEIKNRTNDWYEYCVGNSGHIDVSNHSNETTTKKSMIIRLKNKQEDNSTCWLLTAQEMDFTKFLRIRQMKLFPGSVYKPTVDLHKYITKQDRRQLYFKTKFGSLIGSNYMRTNCISCVTWPQTQTTIDPMSELAVDLHNISKTILSNDNHNNQ